MTFFLNEIGDGIADKLFQRATDAAQGDILGAAIDGSQHVPIVGPLVKDAVKGFHIAKDSMSGVLDTIKEKFIPKDPANKFTEAHKQELLKNFDTDRLHNKLYDDLHYKDDVQGLRKQFKMHTRPRKNTPETALQNKLFTSKRDIKADMLNPDGTFDLSKLTTKEQTLLKERINADTRHGFNINEERLFKGGQIPKYENKNFDAPFTQAERDNLIKSGVESAEDVAEDVAAEEAEEAEEAAGKGKGKEPETPEIPEVRSAPEIPTTIPAVKPVVNIPSTDPILEDPTTVKNPIKGESGKLEEKLKNIIDDLDEEFIDVEDGEVIGAASEDFLREIYDKLFFPDDDIDISLLLDSRRFPEVEDLQLDFFTAFKNDNTGNPNWLIANLEDLTEKQIEAVEKYNSEVDIKNQVSSTQALTLDIIKNDNVIPEVVKKLTTDGLEVKGAEDFTKAELRSYTKEVVKNYNSKTFNNQPSELYGKRLGKTAEQIAKQKEFAGRGNIVGETTEFPNVQTKPKVLGKTTTTTTTTPTISETGEIIQPTGATTSFSGLDTPPLGFEVLADKMTEALVGLTEFGKQKAIKAYEGMTWQQIATLGVSGGLTAIGYFGNQQNTEELTAALEKMPKALRDSLGIDLAVFKTVSSLKPTNTTLSGIADTVTKLHKLSQQLGTNQRQAKEAINIFNQPSNSIITDNDNKRRMDKAESKVQKNLENTKSENIKLQKQVKIAKAEDERAAVKKLKDTREIKEKEIKEKDRIADNKAGQDARRSTNIMGGDTIKQPTQPTSSNDDNDKSVNISIINDSSVPNSTGILKLNPQPILSQGHNFLPALTKKIKKKENDESIIPRNVQNGMLKKNINNAPPLQQRLKLL